VSQTNSEVRNRHQYFPSAFTQASAGEFSAIAGVTDERHQVKELFRHPRIIPRIVVLDPAVTVHTPEWLWLSTGVRAVDHCVEGICSGDANPYADAQALHGLALLYRGLPRIKADPSDLAARLDCQIGSSLSMGRSPAVYRWERAIVSAMCWVRFSASRTAIPRASCCRQ
jgi:alcohol dehydrogenase class IV